MRTHALLGATGNTGSAILRSLLQQHQQQKKAHLTLNLYIRNEEKLLLLFPSLLDQSAHPIITIHLFTTPTSLPDCLYKASIIYNCIAPSTPSKQNNLETHFAAQLISALPPTPTTILWNRSIGLNPQIRNPVPPFIEVILNWAVDWAFDDMRSAQKLYEQAAEEGRLRLVCVDAPKLFDEMGRERCGFELVPTGIGEEKGEVRVRTGLYYADLGDGFVEIARREAEGEWKGVKAVGVGSKGKVRVNLFVVVWSLCWLLVRGVMGRIFGV